MVIDKLFGEVYTSKKFKIKKFLRPIVAALAMAVALLILIWALGYFNQSGDNFILTNLNNFFINNWYFIAGFVLVIGVWDYLYGLYYKKPIRYLAPFFDALSAFFAIWLIAVILNGLRIFIEADNRLNIFLRFLHDLFYEQTILLGLLLILIYYSKFFLHDRNY